MRRVTVEFQGEWVEGEEIEFEATKEAWIEYACADGTKLRIKTFVAKIVRLDERDPNTGEPLYVVNSSNLVTAHVPAHLMVQG